MSATEESGGPTTLRLYRPLPPVDALKLDWSSTVGATGVLLDWVPERWPIDAMVPPDVLPVLAAGLCAAATVAACTERVPDDVGSDWTRVPEGFACRLGSGWIARPRAIGVRASRDPVEVARFFDETYFSWSQEAQLLFLSPPHALPTLDRSLVEACFALPVAVTPERLRAAGVTGLVRAGVDGDVAGLYVLDAAVRGGVLGALERAARAAGVQWEEHDGAAHPAVQAGGAR